VLSTRKLAIVGLDYEILPADDSPEAERIAEFCRMAVKQIRNLRKGLMDMLDGIGKGFGAVELMWEVTEGQAYIRSMEWCHQKRFIYGPLGTPLEDLRLRTEDDLVNGIPLPPNKFAVFQYQARSGHPARGGLLRVCVWMYLFKNYALKDWVAFGEVFGQPYRLGRYPPGATQDYKNELMRAVRQLGTDGAGIISKDAEV
jgi:phage gp29-like protein